MGDKLITTSVDKFYKTENNYQVVGSGVRPVIEYPAFDEVDFEGGCHGKDPVYRGHSG